MTSNTINVIDFELQRLNAELARARADQHADALAVLASLASDTAAAELRRIEAALEARIALRARTVELLEDATAALREARDSLAALQAAPPLPALSASTRRELERRAAGIDAALACFEGA
jgi:hypothetical protein